MAELKKYETIFFDLDHTLWDYEANSLEALNELHSHFDLYNFAGVTLDRFLKTFKSVNDGLWSNYNRGAIDRDHIKKYRFNNILKSFGVEDIELSMEMSSLYISECPKKTNLMPYAIETLDYLNDKYRMFLLTNGFDDVQQLKLRTSNLEHYFKDMITSETCGHRKPSREIFDYTLKKANTKAEQTIMIGDNLAADIVGARNATIDTVYYNPTKESHKEDVNFEIRCLSELTNIL